MPAATPTTVRQQLVQTALERGLRQSTVASYERLLGRILDLESEAASISQETVLEALWTIDNVNTRRAAVIALRSVFGWRIKIPRGVPRRYVLPDEDTLRLALLTTPHETRGLLMMYAGLRVGEACAVTGSDIDGDRLTVDKQVQQLHHTGRPTVTKVGPVKSSVGTVTVPHWLAPRIAGLSDTALPDQVRESLRRAGQRVGISLNPHQLRHWYATTLLDRGVPLITVSRAMRHSDVSVTLRNYAQADDAGSIHQAFG